MGNRQDSSGASAEGRTCLAHVEQLLAGLRQSFARSDAAITGGRRLRAAEREELRRELAGVVASVETIRIWLDAGAPR